MKYEVREMFIGLREVFTYFQCAECDCLQIAEIPSNIDKYYPDNYYSYTPYKKKKFLKQLELDFKDKYAVFNKGLIGKVLCKMSSTPSALESLAAIDIDYDSKILDVGCGSGSLLCAMARLGFRNLVGIDPYISSSIKYPDGVTIEKKFITDIDGKWNLIMFHHSFEHLPDPLETLEVVSNRLSIGGVCLLRIPTVSSFAWDHYKADWVQLDAPRHFFLHSLQSVSKLVSKVNLKVEKVIYDSNKIQFYGSEQYLRDIPHTADISYAVNSSKSIFSRTEIKEFNRKARQLNKQNQGDQAAFILKKLAN